MPGVACRDHFCQQLDNSTSGIKATIAKLMLLLEAHDPELAAHLQKNKVGTTDTHRHLPWPCTPCPVVWITLPGRPAGTASVLCDIKGAPFKHPASLPEHQVYSHRGFT